VGDGETRRLGDGGMGDFGVLWLLLLKRDGLDSQIYLTENIAFFEV